MNIRCPNCFNDIQITETIKEVDTKQRRIEMSAQCQCGWGSRPRYERWEKLNYE